MPSIFSPQSETDVFTEKYPLLPRPNLVTTKDDSTLREPYSKLAHVCCRCGNLIEKVTSALASVYLCSSKCAAETLVWNLSMLRDQTRQWSVTEAEKHIIYLHKPRLALSPLRTSGSKDGPVAFCLWCSFSFIPRKHEYEQPCCKQLCNEIHSARVHALMTQAKEFGATCDCIGTRSVMLDIRENTRMAVYIVKDGSSILIGKYEKDVVLHNAKERQGNSLQCSLDGCLLHKSSSAIETPR